MFSFKKLLSALCISATLLTASSFATSNEADSKKLEQVQAELEECLQNNKELTEEQMQCVESIIEFNNLNLKLKTLILNTLSTFSAYALAPSDAWGLRHFKAWTGLNLIGDYILMNNNIGDIQSMAQYANYTSVIAFLYALQRFRPAH